MLKVSLIHYISGGGGASLMISNSTKAMITLIGKRTTKYPDWKKKKYSLHFSMNVKFKTGGSLSELCPLVNLKLPKKVITTD